MLKKLFFKMIQKYRHATIPKWWILVLDICLFVVAFLVTEVFSFWGDPKPELQSILIKFIIVGIMVTLCLMASGTHRSIIRHSGLRDIIRILFACIVPTIICCVVNLVNNNLHLVQQNILLSYREILLLFAILSIMMIVMRLFMQRIYNDYFRPASPVLNVIIYGAGSAGVIAYNALMQDLHFSYKVVAFIDDDKTKVNQRLNDIPIMSMESALTEKFIALKRVEQLIIAIPNIDLAHKQEISNHALGLGLVVKSVPHINLWIDGSFSSNQLQDIKIEDLLQRESIKLDNINVIREVLDKTVLVTGAAGSIGSEICRQLIQYKPAKIIMLDQAESPMYDLQFELKNNEPYKQSVDRMEFVIANVKDKSRMEEVFEKFHPQLVYHAAAYKHVPFMEENPYEAIYVNVFGTKNLADLAIKYGAQKFVMISTDKAVNPTNVMGATKRMAEIYIQSRSSDQTHFVTTRFGNVLGSNGSVIPLFKKQLAAGGPLTVTHKDIIRYFMTIPEACNLVLEAGAMGIGGDIFVFDMGKPVKIYDLATKMIQLSGIKNIEIKEIGLRPGEKLYEELLATKENTIPTYHPKIMHAQVRQYALDEVNKEYDELWEILHTLDDMKIVSKMKHIVPEFISNNSIYCQLDQKES